MYLKAILAAIIVYISTIAQGTATDNAIYPKGGCDDTYCDIPSTFIMGNITLDLYDRNLSWAHYYSADAGRIYVPMWPNFGTLIINPDITPPNNSPNAVADVSNGVANRILKDCTAITENATPDTNDLTLLFSDNEMEFYYKYANLGRNLSFTYSLTITNGRKNATQRCSFVADHIRGHYTFQYDGTRTVLTKFTESTAINSTDQWDIDKDAPNGDSVLFLNSTIQNAVRWSIKPRIKPNMENGVMWDNAMQVLSVTTIWRATTGNSYTKQQRTADNINITNATTQQGTNTSTWQAVGIAFIVLFGVLLVSILVYWCCNPNCCCA
jgi:hypothetical protein